VLRDSLNRMMHVKCDGIEILLELIKETVPCDVTTPAISCCHPFYAILCEIEVCMQIN
jgi:hypothetical protein